MAKPLYGCQQLPSFRGEVLGSLELHLFSILSTLLSSSLGMPSIPKHVLQMLMHAQAFQAWRVKSHR